jgi:hypothetical protein
MSTRSEFRGIQWDVDAVVGADFLLTVPFVQDGLPHPWAGVTVAAAIMSSGESIQVISVSTAVAGQLTFSLTEAQTAAIGKGRYRWAVTFTIAGLTFPVLAGRFELHLSEVSAVTPPPASSIEVSPSGVTGAVPLGLPATIAIGTVTTLDTGVPASATITGTGATRQLNLGLPRGATGSDALRRFIPWSADTAPLYLDQFWSFFKGVGFVTGQGVASTTVATLAVFNAITLVVADASTYVPGELIVVGRGTPNQQISRIASIASNTLTLTDKNTAAHAIGTTVSHVWGNDTHVLDSPGTTAYTYWLANLRMTDAATGLPMNPNGEMVTFGTDALAEANVPTSWESITPASVSFVIAAWAATGTPNTRRANGGYWSATASGAGVRTLPSLRVRPGEIYTVSAIVKTASGVPTVTVVDKDAPGTVLATISLTHNHPTQVNATFKVPPGVFDVEIRITQSTASAATCFFDDVRLIRRHDLTDVITSRFVFDDLSRPIVWLGDSWADGMNGALQTQIRARAAGLGTIIDAGVPGQRADQMAARITADVLPHAPNYCLVNYGANDLSGGRTQAQMEADTDSIISQLRAAGIKPVILGVPPIASVLSNSNDRNDQCRARADLAA